MNTQFKDLWGECCDTVEDASGPVEQLQAMEPMLEAVAEAKVKGKLDEAQEEAWVQQITDKVDITKSGVREAFKSAAQEAEDELRERDDPGYIPRLDHFIEKNLTEVVIHQTTDKHSDTGYHWRFNNGVMFSTTGGTHWSWPDFEDLLYDEMLVETRQPERKDSRDWKEWMRGIINDRKRVEETVGPRTEAVNDIAAYITRTTAYPSAEKAAGWNGVWATEDQDWVGVKSERVSEYATEHEIEVRGLQEELDARGHLADTVEQVFLPDGQYVRFWKLSKDLAGPDYYETDAGDPYSDTTEDEPDEQSDT